MATAPALAQTPAEKAAELNKEGKQAYKQKNYAAAAQKFRQAIVLSPEGRFYFNLCFVLAKQGKFRQALTACEAVAGDNASTPLVEKTEKFIRDKIRPNIRSSEGGGSEGGDGGGGEGGGGDGGDGSGGGEGSGGGDDSGGGGGPGDDSGGGGGPGDDSGGGGGPGDDSGGDGGGPGVDSGGGGDRGDGSGDPGVDIEGEAEAGPTDAYKWSLGAEIGPVINLSVGESTDDSTSDAFAKSGAKFRGHINFLINDPKRLGLQGYFGVVNLEPGEDFLDALQIIEFGGALFQHRPIRENIHWTWLGGAHIAAMNIGGVDQDNLVTFGFRGELSVSYLLGSQFQHEIKLTPIAVDIYLPAASESGTAGLAEGLFLDEPGATWAITLGYTARFSSDFGTKPLFTLE